MGNGAGRFRPEGLDLTSAIRILQNAGRVDPTRFGTNRTEQLQALIDALCDLSVHDGLTGLVNATFFQAALTSELDRCFRTGRSCGLLMLDLDHFKSVNDTYGHHVGDFVLQSVAAQLRRSLRSMDTASRIGGEEFAVILPECSAEYALRAATRIHAAVNPLVLSAGAETLRITASAGLVWTEPKINPDPAVLIAAADEELYRAKRSGRKRLCHPPISQMQVTSEERAALALLRHQEDSHG